MTLPPFDARERRAIEAAMIFRSGGTVPLEEAEVELLLDPASEAPTACPGIYWRDNGVQFVVCKTAARRYRSYFFHIDAEQYRIGEQDYEDIETCLRDLLRKQEEHERQRREFARKVATTAPPEDDFYGKWII